MSVLAGLIWLVHMLLISFIVLVPFFGNVSMLVIHVIITPFILLHWVTNNDVCCLTELEFYFRGGSRDATFFGKIIHPVYRLHRQDESFLIRIVTVILMLIAMSKLYEKRDELWEIWYICRELFEVIQMKFFGKRREKILSESVQN